MHLFKYFVAVALTIASITQAWAANPTTTSVAPAHPLVHQFNIRLKKQWMLIQQGLKAGKLTKDQAVSLRANLKSARQQEVAFFKQNGNHDLTAAEESQLNTILDKNSAVLGESVPASASN